MFRRLIKGMDYRLLGAASLLIIFSLVTIGSSTMEYTDSSMEKIQGMNILFRLLELDYSFVFKQLVWILLGLAAALFILYIDYEDISRYSKHLYVINLIMLAAVMVVGQTALGAQRWISIGPFQFQPSEFSKLIIIITFADFLSKRKGRLNSFRDLIPCFVYIGIPMLLILTQPDLGTSLVFLAIMFGMLFIAGARPAVLVGIIAFGAVMCFSLYESHQLVHHYDTALKERITHVSNALNGNDYYLDKNEELKKDIKQRGFSDSGEDLGKYLEEIKKEQLVAKNRHEKFHKYTLKEYQMTRLTIFMNPEDDLLGAGYHVWQSRIAIGSGGVTGKGLLKGTQSHYTFLPIRHTDFIFSVVGEEFGFIGAAFLLGLYFVLLYRGLQVVAVARDTYGMLLAAGVVSMFAFHIFQNIGMTTGVMPVAGIPLPLFSYGGSNMVMNLASLGLLLNVYVRRQKLIF